MELIQFDSFILKPQILKTMFKIVLTGCQRRIYNVYESLPVQTKIATLILLAILMYKHYIHHTQINLRSTRSFWVVSSVLISHFRDISGFDSDFARTSDSSGYFSVV